MPPTTYPVDSSFSASLLEAMTTWESGADKIASLSGAGIGSLGVGAYYLNRNADRAQLEDDLGLDSEKEKLALIIEAKETMKAVQSDVQSKAVVENIFADEITEQQSVIEHINDQLPEIDSPAEILGSIALGGLIGAVVFSGICWRIRQSRKTHR